MEWVIVAFRSRTHTLRFSAMLKQSGIGNSVVNTPKAAGVGCGLSVKIGKEVFQAVRRATFNSGLNSFAGFFLVKLVNGREIVKSI